MRALAATAALAALAIAGVLALAGRPGPPAAAFSEAERGAILAHGPWPPPPTPDPSNRVSGNSRAIALGKQLFSDRRLSSDGQRSCVTCHDPARFFADGRDRSVGRSRVDRNAIALANLRLNRWFGWSGAADSLWAQSMRPILDEKELGATAQLVRERLAADPAVAATYTELFSSALERRDREVMVRYPAAAQRGLKIFVGKGQCTACHFGPSFTNGEFDDVGVPHFAERARVDQGRHGGIAELLASPFNLLGRYNDDPTRVTAEATRHVEPQHRNWGEFRVPSLRNVAMTAPYMHGGSMATLEAVVRHYSEVDVERLHGDEGARLVRPLQLSRQETADLVAFLETLSGPISHAH